MGAIFDHAVFSMKRLQAQFSCISALTWLLARKRAKGDSWSQLIMGRYLQGVLPPPAKKKTSGGEPAA